MTTDNRKQRFRPYPAYKPSSVEWLGEIPEHWERVLLKRLSRIGYGDSLPTGSRCEGGIKVYGSNGVVGVHDTANTMTPVIIIGRKGSYGKLNYSEEPCFSIDTTYFIDFTKTGADLRWLFYVLSCLRLDEFTEDSAVPGLSREYVYSRYIPLLEEAEQRAIAAFLDRETAKIDALVAEKDRLIGLLEERRAALISRAVTRGLDADAPLKPSGVPWLGEIPEHWVSVELKRLFNIVNGSTPSSSNPDFWNGDIVWITPEDLGKLRTATIMGSDRMISKKGYLSCGTTLVPVGSLVVSTRAPVGYIGIAGIELCTNQGCRSLEFLDVDDTKYFYYALSAAREELGSLACGSTFRELGKTELGQVTVPRPPEPEQRAIAAFLDRETAKIDALVAKVREGIEKLKEYRTALISAAVTGKIDVRGEAEEAAA